MQKLSDRIAVVTGASSGIGRATAVALSQKGCHVALADVDADGLEETATQVETSGRRATRHQVDVADRKQMERLVAEVEKEHGAAHVVVNNAGVSVAKTFEDHTIEDFEWLLGINLWGVIYGCKLFLPMLKRADEAHIVNISSVFGIAGFPMNSSYCASKFAVRGLSESLRAELADAGIGVTSVHPGGIATNIVSKARWGEDAGRAKEELVTMFQSMMPPSEAARQIVRGIETNAPRVLITREAYVLDTLARLSPKGLARLVLTRWRKFQATGKVEI